jgi:hypothetical protein
MIIENMHWTDPTSLEVFSLVVNRIKTLRVLLVVTFRPEFEPPWIGRPHVTAVTLSRLPDRDVEAMIDHIVGNQALPASLRPNIVERTDSIFPRQGPHDGIGQRRSSVRMMCGSSQKNAGDDRCDRSLSRQRQPAQGCRSWA